MKKIAFVLGFGYGQANRDIASFTEEINKSVKYDLILSQYAVKGFLLEKGLNPIDMHYHCDIYINTMDAIGLALLELQRGNQLKNKTQIEIISHTLHINRARKAGNLALELLLITPPNTSTIKELLRCLGRVDIISTRTPDVMRMNRIYESFPQIWTCSRWLYGIIESKAEQRDFVENLLQYKSNSQGFYDHIIELHKMLENSKRKARMRSNTKK